MTHSCPKLIQTDSCCFPSNTALTILTGNGINPGIEAEVYISQGARGHLEILYKEEILEIVSFSPLLLNHHTQELFLTKLSTESLSIINSKPCVKTMLKVCCINYNIHNSLHLQRATMG